MIPCYICQSASVSQLLDLGPQPICNRFLLDPKDDEYTHPMVVGQCQACGLIQISDPVPAAEVLPRHQWITYMEPEEHLDQLAEVIAALPGLTSASRICGVTYKDDSLVARMEDRGFKNAWRIGQERDLGITEPGAGDETIQDRLTLERAGRIAAERGLSEVVIVRHVLEHAHDPLGFLDALRRLVAPGGYLVVEAPDTTRSLKLGDASSMWEEHILYFTPETFKNAFTYGGLSAVHYQKFHYSDENTMTVIARPDSTVNPVWPAAPELKKEIDLAQGYAEDLASQRKKTAAYLSEIRRTKGGIAVFGAGHRSVTYLNLLGLAAHVDFVVDDNPNKCGLYMPGSRLPIKASQALTEEDIKLCFLAVKAESEDKITGNNQAYVDQGGAFSSIYPSSKLALRV